MHTGHQVVCLKLKTLTWTYRSKVDKFLALLLSDELVNDHPLISLELITKLCDNWLQVHKVMRCTRVHCICCNNNLWLSCMQSVYLCLFIHDVGGVIPYRKFLEIFLQLDKKKITHCHNNPPLFPQSQLLLLYQYFIGPLIFICCSSFLCLQNLKKVARQLVKDVDKTMLQFLLLNDRHHILVCVCVCVCTCACVCVCVCV